MSDPMTIEAMLTEDMDARRVALTALDRTLLVEAGAGSGKTSVLAGRVAALLAAGRAPSSIAAISFTELAAGELRERVTAFVTELSDGHVRPDLRAAFPDKPTPAQRAALARARDTLDELTCTTIHGFCQRLLRPYPVEAGMDPGAAVMDRADAEALFDIVLDEFLRERLSAERRPGDLLVALYLEEPKRADELVRTVARHLLQNRGADVPELDRLDDALAGLRAAARAFRTFLQGAACHEPGTAAIVSELEELIETAPDAADEGVHLLHLLHLPAPASHATADGNYKVYKFKGKWQEALTAAGSKVKADVLHRGALDCHGACREAHEAVRAYAAGRLLRVIAIELRTVFDRFAAAKRAAAQIDFDDLMVQARDLLVVNPAVRDALAQRFSTILVDEFQDTDHLQCEILWRLGADAPDTARPWMEWPLRPGALFLVGDPKQAIYRFRGADVRSYVAARTRVVAADPAARIVIAQNFRSLGAILDWVNARFEPVLRDPPQPGFQRLFSTAEAPPGHVAVATLPVPNTATGSDALRDAEAEAVAALCGRIIGALPVRGRDGMRLCRPDDIALLAPTGTDLWRYERALELAGIAVSTQAGKGFYRRQEVQDMLALTRVLADPADTLALGALLRGPLVGLTEEALLDATAALPERNGTHAGVRLWTSLTDVQHPLLRQTLEILQTLAGRAHSTTPFVLLSQAAEELQVRPLLRQRQDRTAERALANLDQFLEAARAYDMRGLHAFALEMRAQWQDAQRAIEGRPDTEQQSVSIVTMHSSKGLEWPVVIPVNLSTQPNNHIEAALDVEGRLHMRVFGRHPPGSAQAYADEKAAGEQQRHRLWYVAATRARDLLLLPQFGTGVPAGSFMQKVGLDWKGLDPFGADAFDGHLHRDDDPPNPQDRDRFMTEAALIASRTHQLRRTTPHLAETDETIHGGATLLPPDVDDPAPQDLKTRGGLARGRVLHKLIEEILTGELDDATAALVARGNLLAAELGGMPGAAEADAAEIAATVRRTLLLPEVAAVRLRLIPECVVACSRQVAEWEDVILGIADAIALDDEGKVGLVVDWKSDIDPAPAALSHYRAQLAAYLDATGCPKGLLVFVTTGVVQHVQRRTHIG